MAAQSFRIVFTQSAWADLEEIVAYWTDHDEPERGEQGRRRAPGRATADYGNVIHVCVHADHLIRLRR